MPSTTNLGGGFNPANDPGLSQALADFQSQIQSLQAEWQVLEARSHSESAAITQAAESARTELAEVEQIARSKAARRDVPQVAAADSVDSMPLSAGIAGVGNLLATAAHSLLGHADQPPPLPAGEPQWHYAVGGQSQGPVPQSELIRLLAGGRLPWNALVWNKSLRDWLPASQTELRELAAVDVPPPLPGAIVPPLADASAAACPSCGHVGEPGDRYCAACGGRMAE